MSRYIISSWLTDKDLLSVDFFLIRVSTVSTPKIYEIIIFNGVPQTIAFCIVEGSSVENTTLLHNFPQMLEVGIGQLNGNFIRNLNKEGRLVYHYSWFFFFMEKV